MAAADRQVIGGVDTHKDIHVAAVVDEQGRISTGGTHHGGAASSLPLEEATSTLGISS